MNKHQHPELKVSDDEARKQLSGRTRRGLLVGGLGAIAGAGFYEWVTGSSEDENRSKAERRVLDANGKLAEAYLSDSHRMQEFSPDQIGGVKPNGNIGLDGAPDLQNWKMDVSSAASNQKWGITLEEIKKLPRVEMITRFCCIEGWSGISQWAGVPFALFTQHLFGTSTKMLPYVSMMTADEEYYVGLDRKSAMHPQTLLAYEQNGKPLEERHGAPLRLVIPVKYGIKNIKRIGQIQYVNDRPADYWAEDGYDWFAGL